MQANGNVKAFTQMPPVYLPTRSALRWITLPFASKKEGKTHLYLH